MVQELELAWRHTWSLCSSWKDISVYSDNNAFMSIVVLRWYVYRLIKRKFDVCKEDWMHHTRVSKVTAAVVKMCEEQNLLAANEHLPTLSAERHDQVFTRSIEVLLQWYLSTAQLSWRPLEMCYGSVYNLIVASETLTSSGKLEKKYS